MAKFKKKPVVIEAVSYPFTPDCPQEFKDAVKIGPVFSSQSEHLPHIETLEGAMVVSAGDYIIKGVKGEFYPCKPDIFEATYEAVD
jgi:hypothetical protein